MEKAKVYGWDFSFMKYLIKFSELARTNDDLPFAEQCQAEAARLAANIEKTAWDGEWYRRAYFDDGTPLGMSRMRNAASILFHKAGRYYQEPGIQNRSRMAMESAYKYLVRKDKSLIQFLDPPFDKVGTESGLY